MPDITVDGGGRKLRLFLNILGIVLSLVLLSYYIPFLKNASLMLRLTAGGILILIVACSLAVYIMDLYEILYTHRRRTLE